MKCGETAGGAGAVRPRLDRFLATGRTRAGRPQAQLGADAKTLHTVTGLLVACPITSRRKGYPFEVAVEAESVSGVILADHLKSLDRRQRNVTRIGRADPETMDAVVKLIGKLLGTG